MLRRTTAVVLPLARTTLPALLFPRRLLATAAMASQTPMEDAIRTKVTDALNPSRLEIFNDSHKHAHHKPMQGSTSGETHFRVVITSEAFRSKMQPARHRLIYGLLRDEMAAEGGIHALQLRTMTPEEEERQNAKAEAEKA
ncbi:bola protein [Xylaria bambusicola]|uniref:bola protein n=1 Tax=Xylaria bambusicola TaxID=326684 RepID=UPI002008248C|nr:bola protein [Xylaria bambusicola]KAI0505837.1 bola protein [Xylaria bambusicola]